MNQTPNTQNVALELAKLSPRIEATLATKVSLADFENAIPLIRELRVMNDEDRGWRNLELHFNPNGAPLHPKLWRIDELSPASTFQPNDVDLRLDGAALGRLTESEKVEVHFSLRQACSDEAPLATWSTLLELLPRNQWGGLNHVPDLAAAFVQPNDPAVDRVLKRAAEVLRNNGKDPAMNGYDGGPKGAWELASAIWGAVTSMGLDYAFPPASFEQHGQKVRGPSQIAESGLATCMDLSLFFAAALEQAGLHPLLVFTEGHVFAGLWLSAEEFSTVVVDEVSALRKRAKLNELILFETTLATQRPALPFSQAVANGLRKIEEEHEANFQMAIDVRRARIQKVKPLASAEGVRPQAVVETEDLAIQPIIEEAPGLPDTVGTVELGDELLSPKDRLDRWQRKLLDLSLTNNLLNFKVGARSLKLEAPDPGQLEDMLAQELSLKLLARPDLMDGNDPRNRSIHESRSLENLHREHAIDGLRRREVFVDLPPKELEARLVQLYRASRASLQEGGANTLFLALGFLAWTREDKADRRLKAPLILIPVSLKRNSVRSGFTLSLHEDEPRFNPTLLQMLRQDFNLNLAVGQGELPKDDYGLDVAGIWKSVALAIKEIPGWEVTEEVCLSTFSFAKYLMWKDLVEQGDRLRENAVVRHLLDNPRDSFLSGTPFLPPHQLDASFTPQQSFCPLPADSSQLAAVMAGAMGKDFVLIGPPGTGKSQTIANLIAQCLAEGKRVLFVSEKIAALDVVYRRLREVGLGDFCLELHSNKARKQEVLEQLRDAWEAQGGADQATWEAEAQRLEKLRNQLNTYVSHLHRRHPNGLSIFDAIGQVAKGEKLLRLRLHWPTAGAHDAAGMAHLRECISLLEVNAKGLGSDTPGQHPLRHVGESQWAPLWQQELAAASEALQHASQLADEKASALLISLGLPPTSMQPEIQQALVLLAQHLPRAAGHDWRHVLAPDAQQLAEKLNLGLALVKEHQELNAKLSPLWDEATMEAGAEGIRLRQRRQLLLHNLPTPWSPTLRESLGEALQRLAELEEAQNKLSQPYDEQIFAHDLLPWLHEWNAACRSIWPLSILKKGSLVKKLAPYAMAAKPPLPEQDLSALVAIQKLRRILDATNFPALPEGLWAGLATRRERPQAALALQGCLQAVLDGNDWQDTGLDVVAEGFAGPILQKALKDLRELQRVDEGLVALAHLTQATPLWQNDDDSHLAFEIAHNFMAARRKLGNTGALEGHHSEISQGMAGSTLAQDAVILARRLQVEGKLAELEGLASLTRGLWRHLDSSSQEVEAAATLQAALQRALGLLAVQPSLASRMRDSLEQLLGDGRAQLEPNTSLCLAFRSLLDAASVLPGLIDKWAAFSKASPESLAQLSQLSWAQWAEHMGDVANAANRLRPWCAWVKARDQANKAGLGLFGQAVAQGALLPDAIGPCFEANYCRWWLDSAVQEDEVIRSFVSAEHEKRIADFKALDDRFTDLTKQLIRAKLCGKLPSQDDVTRNPEWGVLRHELSKKKRHMPLRELVAKLPKALTMLTPCLLMSPLSIAQYLPVEQERFDLVVFDEASQIPVWDAVGAIARGNQVVMVGDPKQLPPTSFFGRSDADVDEEDVEGDLESILDQCLGASLPTIHLNWHYRSRNESLIAFSNRYYYGGNLVTFPSPVTQDKAVSFHWVPSTYEKGGTRTNPDEAKALVADLVGRLKSPGFRETGLTIGVVTFNAQQQELIENLLDEARRKDPSIECHFSEDAVEGVFVKNLESVQGDERDIMYFSITYGPDQQGKLSMNFGPMNRDGGERRLNVAITRARHELRVFSCLRAEQMDMSRTHARGVRDLKLFLEFAERGAKSLAQSPQGSLGGYDSPFEEAVAEALAAKGWELHTQVGVSAFRIDLAVVDPDAPGSYLAGLECDGATYHRSATAKDRDKLREQVLRSLGWKILRIWSTDWWVDAPSVALKLDTQLKALHQETRQRREEALATAQAALEATQIESAQAESQAPEADMVPPFGPEVQQEYPLQGATYRSPEPAPLLERTQQISSQQVPHEGRFYVEANPLAVVRSINPDAFHTPEYDAQLRDMIAHVVNVEGPILGLALARRIARAHGWARTGGRIQERVIGMAEKHHAHATEEAGQFFWPSGQDPNTPIPFRKPAPNVTRAADEMCQAELDDLARQVLKQTSDDEEAMVAMAQALGFNKPRFNMHQALSEALKRCR